MIHAENVFEGSDGTLNSGTSGVQIGPLRAAAQDTWIEAQVGVGIDVNTAAILRSSAGILAVAAERTAIDRSAYEGSLWTDELQSL